MKDKYVRRHMGCDGLTVAFQGCLTEKGLETVTRYKDEAAAVGGEIAMEISGVRFNMMDKGSGPKQGYAFQFHTGRKGIKYQAKKSTDASQWNLRARVSALFLAERGILEAHSQIYKDLRALGTVIIDESVSNVDFAVDIQTESYEAKPSEKFRLDPSLFVHHSRATKRQYYSRPENQNGDDLSVFGNAFVETVTIGGRSGRQLCVYNKRAEQKAKRRNDWFEIWEQDAKECPTIWRAEYRFGKDFLRDWNIRTIDDVVNCYGDLLHDSIVAIRYVDETGDSRKSRRDNHAFWNAIIEGFVSLCAGGISGIQRGRLKTIEAKDQNQIYHDLVTGIAASMAVVQGADIESEDDLDRFLEGFHLMMKRRLTFERDKFRASFKRTEKRLIFEKPCGIFEAEGTG